MIKNITLMNLLLVFISTMTGCTTIKKEGVDAHFEIITSNYINPDDDDESRPLNITFFYLKDTESFLQADYFDLFQSGSNPIAGSLIHQSNVLVVPNNRKLYSEEVPENVRAIGVIYQFRKLDKSQWRAVIDTPETCFLGLYCSSILNNAEVFISIDDLNTKIKLVD